MVIDKRKGQSLLEYAILLAVVIAALVIMQFIIKRGYEGSLKESSDKMGDRYSIASSTSQTERTMIKDQWITDHQATGEQMSTFKPAGFQGLTATGVAAGQRPKDLITPGVIGYVDRRGGDSKIASQVKTDGVKDEKLGLTDMPSTGVIANFPEPTLGGS